MAVSTNCEITVRPEIASRVDVVGPAPVASPASSPVASPDKRATSSWARRLLPIWRKAVKVAGVSLIAACFLMGLLHWPQCWINDEHVRSVVLSVLFLAGLVMVVVEEHVDVNKAAIMLMVSSAMWTFLAVSFHPNSSEEGHEEFERELERGLKDVGSIVLFLLPAMGVVESIDHFDGFAVVTYIIHFGTGNRRSLLMPALCFITFFLSAIIDNLTATIVALKILRHAAGDDRHLRHLIGGAVVIAANAGGAWSPVGDVTTTMLWIHGKISLAQTVSWLFLPSCVTAFVPMLGLWFQACSTSSSSGAKKDGEDEDRQQEQAASTVSTLSSGERGANSKPVKVTLAKVLVLVLGLMCIFMVPVLKIAIALPPYMGMLLALGIIWFTTDTMAFRHLLKSQDGETGGEEVCRCESTPRTQAKARSGDEGVIEALHKMDLTGLLFFAGVLLAVGALDTAGVLRKYAEFLVNLCGGSSVLICTLLGISSAVVDNVPLVQASINMFHEMPTDDPLWQLVALAAGTGGSILSVGSIAGVTLMTMEGVGYLWYCRRISHWAALGFGLGLGTYELQRALLR